MYDFPFHMLFLIYCLLMLSYRFYYMGLADASKESVPKFEEGLLLRRIRYCLGLPFLVGVLVYLINPTWMQWASIPNFPQSLRWFGMFLLFFSFVLYKYTHISLDKNFTDTVYVRQESILITTGPYKWIRHPMYVSAMLAALGIGFGLANWFLGTVGITLMAVIIFWRTPIEEKKLLKRHGEEYRAYREKTGKFFPKFFK